MKTGTHTQVPVPMTIQPPLYYSAKLQKIIEKTKRFPDYFLTKTPPRRKETEAADFRFSILIFGEQIKDFNRPPSRSV